MTTRWVLWPCAVFALLFASASEARRQTEPSPEATSFVDGLRAILPVFECLDRAPPDASDTRDRCLAEGGIREADLDMKSGPVAPAHLLPFAMIFGGTDGIQFPPPVRARSLAYAQCIEPRAAATPVTAGASERTYRSAIADIQAPCLPLIPAAGAIMKADAPLDDSAAFLLGRIMGNLTIAHHARARGWFPKEMEPCVRYLDGRPPSPSCADERSNVLPAPPPQIGR